MLTSRITKVSFFVQCIKMQLIAFQNFNIQTYLRQFLWVFSLKCWFKGQMISKSHLSLPNAYRLMCFDRNINVVRDVKLLEYNYLLVQWCVKLTLTYPLTFIAENLLKNKTNIWWHLSLRWWCLSLRFRCLCLVFE